MITAQTLFILGAGAHKPYGMPDGNGLRREIIKEIPTKLPSLQGGGKLNNSIHDLFFILYASGREASFLNKLLTFREALANAGHSSIDSFLVSYADERGFPEIGKLAVAKVLLQRESDQNLERGAAFSEGRDWDWMTYLFDEMLRDTNRKVEDFLEKNKVAFVTFNYDRTLERFFYLKLRYTFRLTEKDALAALAKIEIKHVYGSLGKFDGDKLAYRDMQAVNFKAAAEGIHLMYEDRGKEENEDLVRAVRLWDVSDTIIFLGFAFDEQNVKILNLNRGAGGKTITATRFGIGDGDWERAMRRMRPTTLGRTPDRKWDSLLLLQETVPSLF